MKMKSLTCVAILLATLALRSSDAETEGSTVGEVARHAEDEPKALESDGSPRLGESGQSTNQGTGKHAGAARKERKEGRKEVQVIMVQDKIIKELRSKVAEKSRIVAEKSRIIDHLKAQGSQGENKAMGHAEFQAALKRTTRSCKRGYISTRSHWSKCPPRLMGEEAEEAFGGARLTALHSYLVTDPAATATTTTSGQMGDTYDPGTCADNSLSDVSSKTSMQSAGWSFDFTNADGASQVAPSCGGGSNWYGWSGGNTVGTLTSPALQGSGTATIEYGNCWDAGSVKLYLNNRLIDTASPNSPKGDTTQKKVFIFHDGDVVSLKDEDGNAVVNLKALTFECPTNGLNEHHNTHCVDSTPDPKTFQNSNGLALSGTMCTKCNEADGRYLFPRSGTLHSNHYDGFGSCLPKAAVDGVCKPYCYYTDMSVAESRDVNPAVWNTTTERGTVCTVSCDRWMPVAYTASLPSILNGYGNSAAVICNVHKTTVCGAFDGASGNMPCQVFKKVSCVNMCALECAGGTCHPQDGSKSAAFCPNCPHCCSSQNKCDPNACDESYCSMVGQI